MKIAFVVNNYPPKTGGLEQHVSSLANHMVARGHEVLVIALADRTSQANENSVRVYRYQEYLRVDGILGFAGPSSLKQIRDLLAAEKVDAISVHTRFFSMTWFGVLLGKLLKVPVIHTEHGSGFVVSQKKYISVASRLVDKTLGVLALKNSTKVLCVSGSSQQFVKELAGVDAEVFYNVSPLPACAAEDVTIDRKKLVFIARVVEVKGWKAYLETVALLHAEDPEIHGVVLGDGADLNKAKAYARELGIADVVDFRGFVTHVDVAKELQGATLVNPTVAAEGFQTTIIDAFVSQAGIVTHDVTSARVLEERGVPLHIVTQRSVENLAAAVRAEIANPQSYKLEEVNRWGWDKQAEEYERVLQRVVR